MNESKEYLIIPTSTEESTGIFKIKISSDDYDMPIYHMYYWEGDSSWTHPGERILSYDAENFITDFKNKERDSDIFIWNTFLGFLKRIDTELFDKHQYVQIKDFKTSE